MANIEWLFHNFDVYSGWYIFLSIISNAVYILYCFDGLLAGIGIPVACFLHGYAGFIFGSVKANALWMSPLMPVIFIMSAVVSGIALCMLTYIIIMEFKKWSAIIAKGKGDKTVHMIAGAELDVITKTSRYLLGFLIAAITLELLDLIFRGYTAMKSWDILRSVMYGKDFINGFIFSLEGHIAVIINYYAALFGTNFFVPRRSLIDICDV